jgi:hypothetical protein
MSKTLEQIQQENREFILEAIHCCDYREALMKELGVGCKVKVKKFFSNSDSDFCEEILIVDKYCVLFLNYIQTLDSAQNHEITEIIGKPLTLTRILSAINAKGGFYDPIRLDDESNTLNFDYQDLSFNLNVETLEEQSEETQRFLNKFFNN